MQEFAYNLMETTILFPVFRLIILDVADKLDEGSKQYYLRARGKMFGDLEQFLLGNRD